MFASWHCVEIPFAFLLCDFWRVMMTEINFAVIYCFQLVGLTILSTPLYKYFHRYDWFFMMFWPLRLLSLKLQPSLKLQLPLYWLHMRKILLSFSCSNIAYAALMATVSLMFGSLAHFYEKPVVVIATACAGSFAVFYGRHNWRTLPTHKAF